jgi:hypothetical protein
MSQSSRLVHTETYDPGTVGDVHPQGEPLVSVTFREERGPSVMPVATAASRASFDPKSISVITVVMPCRPAAGPL